MRESAARRARASAKAPAGKTNIPSLECRRSRPLDQTQGSSTGDAGRASAEDALVTASQVGSFSLARRSWPTFDGRVMIHAGEEARKGQWESTQPQDVVVVVAVVVVVNPALLFRESSTYLQVLYGKFSWAEGEMHVHHDMEGAHSQSVNQGYLSLNSGEMSIRPGITTP